MRNTSNRDSNAGSTQTMRWGTALPNWISRWRYYGLALLLVAAAALLRWMLPGVLGPAPFLIFYLAWVGAAVLGGLGPGLFATAASWLCVELFFNYTPGLSVVGSPTEPARLVVVLVGGLTVSLLAESMRRGRIRERRQMKRLAEQTEQLRTAAEEVRESEEKYRALVENSLVGIGISKGDRIIYANRSLLRMYGYDTLEEFAAQSLLEHLTPRSRRVLEQWGERYLRGEDVPTVLEHDIVRKDGAIRTLQLSVSLLSGHNGVYAHTAFVDITERKRAEEAVAESRKRYRGLVEKVNDWVWEIDANGVYTYASPRAQELLGYAPEEIVGKTPFDFMPPAEAQRVWNAFESIWLGRKPLELLENTLVRKDGRLVTVETSGMPVFAEDGAFLGYTGIDRDVTARKQTEEALRESEQRYRKLFEATVAGAYLTRPDGTFLDCNDALMRMLGYDSREELFQHRSTEFYADPEVRDELMRRLQQDGIVPITEAVLRRKDGSNFYAFGSGVLLTDERTGEFNILGVAIDINERKKAEEALRELTKTLESKVAQRTAELQHRARQLQRLTLDMSEAEDRERQRMADLLHDDLQQELAAAKFQLSMVKNRIRYDALAQTMVARIDQTLKDAIAKSRSLSHELSPAVLHHSDFAETLRWLAEEVQTKHGLVVHVCARGPVESRSDALKGLLYKTARELIFNVVKHAGVREARLRVRQWGQCICLSVSDRGRGFDPQKLGEAAGFGLLSIRERIELLGGRMKIKSAVGQGSTFLIVVPNGMGVGAGGPRAHPALDGHGGKEGGRGGPLLRVLLADDHEIVREGLCSLLSEEPDVEVVGEAANGREAVDLANQLQPDVIVMDMSMPIIEGDEATRQIKEYLPHTRVVAISMYDQAEKVEAMYRAGAESYVLKTAPSEELLAAIRGPEREAEVSSPAR